MGFAEGMGVALSVIISYLITSDMTIALVAGLVFLGLISKGERK